MKQAITILVFMLVVSVTLLLRDASAMEPTLKELVAEIDNLPLDKRKVHDPLAAVRDDAAAVRYFAIGALEASKSKRQAQALVDVLEDDVQWLRYAAAVQLGKAGLYAEQVSPLLVEALSGDDSTFHLWGTRHVIQSLYKVGAPALPQLAIAVDSSDALLRRNACFVLGQFPAIVTDRGQY